MTIKIAYLNGYVGNKTPKRAIRRMLRGRPDSLGWGEGYHNVRNRTFGGFLRYRVFNATAVAFQETKGAHDTPILTLRKHVNRGELALQVSDPSTPIKIAPARWFTASVYDTAEGRVAHINVHPNAAVQNGSRENDRIDEYAQSMEALEKLIDLFKSTECLVVVTGDLNWRQSGDNRPWTPEQVFKRQGMTTLWQGLDCIAYDGKKLVLVGKVEVVPTSQTGSDHPGLIATFRRRPKKS